MGHGNRVRDTTVLWDEESRCAVCELKLKSLNKHTRFQKAAAIASGLFSLAFLM